MGARAESGPCVHAIWVHMGRSYMRKRRERALLVYTLIVEENVLIENENISFLDENQ